MGGTRGLVRAVCMASGGAEPLVHAATTATILRIWYSRREGWGVGREGERGEGA